MARLRSRQLAITAVKAVVAIVVLWAVGRHVLRTYDDLRSKSESLHFDPLWLAISGALYLAGLLACAVFYERILESSGADRLSAGVAILYCEPPRQIRARQGNGRGSPLWDGRALRRTGIDGGNRHVL